MTKYMKKAMRYVYAFLTTFSLVVQLQDWQDWNGFIASFGGYKFQAVLLFGFFCWFYGQQNKKNKSIIFMVLAAISSFFLFVGECFSSVGSVGFAFQGIPYTIISLLVLLGFYMLLRHLFELAYDLITTKVNKNDERRFVVNDKVDNYIRAHIFSIAFLTILVGWLPYIIVFFPGSVPYDGWNQLDMISGVTGFSNHHPYLGTILLGFFYKIGSLISPNMGVFAYILFQVVSSAVIYAVACKWTIQMKTPTTGAIIAIIFYAFVPLGGGFQQAVLKDSLFSAVFVAYLICWLNVIMDIKKAEKIDWKLIGFSILVCLLRNNGKYIVLFSYVCLLLPLLVTRKRFHVTLLSFIAIIGLLQGYEKVLLPQMGVEQGSVREMLSIPIQQSARYIRDYEKDITKEEKNILTTILDYETVKLEYNPEISDPVKRTVLYRPSKEILKEYFQIWFQMFLKHPGVYIEATLQNIFGYFDPFYNYTDSPKYSLYISGPIREQGVDYGIHYVQSDNIRGIMTKYIEFWTYAPGLSILVNPGTYTWIILFLLAIMVRKKKYNAVLMVIPCLVSIACCVASPVNGLMRYMLPVAMGAPVVIVGCLKAVYNLKEVIE